MFANGQNGTEEELVLCQLPVLAEFRFRLRSFLSFSEQKAEALGVTAQQYQMLQVVAEAGEQGCSITHLASRLLLRHNSAVELVDRGERSNLIRRKADTSDLRRSMLEVTQHGQNLLVQLVGQHLRYLQEDGASMMEALARLTVTPEKGVKA